MTGADIKTITDIVHKTIYGFFDICGDDEETPMTDKDDLLLKVNKAICSNIKALEQEPCGDAIDRAEAMTEIMMFAGNVKPDEEDIYIKVSDAVQLLRELPSVNLQEPKTGHWIIYDVHGHKACKCSECGMDVGYPCNDKYCPNCGADMRSDNK